MITAAEIETYHRYGYVVPAGFRLGDDELAGLRTALDKVLADNPEILPDRLINVHLDGGDPYGVRGQKAFHDLAHDPRILDLAQAVMGPDLVLRISFPCPRCVMTTLPRADLPHDPGILRTAAEQNRLDMGKFGRLPAVGVYAEVVKPGAVSRGDTVRLVD